MENANLRARCDAILDHFDRCVAPKLPLLRHQAIHGDFNMGNVLWDDDRESFVGGHVLSGVVDFGDMAFSTLVADIAANLCSIGLAFITKEDAATEVAPLYQMHEKSCASSTEPKATAASNGLLRAARLFLDGYQSEVVLEPAELEVLGDLWLTRVCCEVVITAWRVATGLEPPHRSAPETPLFQAQLVLLQDLGPELRQRALTGCPGCLDECHNYSDIHGKSNSCNKGKSSDKGVGNDIINSIEHEGVGEAETTAALAARREAAIGPGSEPLSYSGGNGTGDRIANSNNNGTTHANVDRQAGVVRVESGYGCWVVEAGKQKKRLLDCYNNVPVEGHAHPRVAAAIAHQARQVPET